MFSMISLVSFGLIYVSSATTATIVGSNQYPSYNKFLSDNIYDCQCTTGRNTEELDLECDDDDIDEYIEGLQEYLMDDGCTNTTFCAGNGYIGTTESSFRCFQAYTLLIQYHVYCPSKSANETLLHKLLDECPDCLETHHQAPYAPECDSSLNCTDIDDQEEEIEFVTENCIATCSDDDCEESWQEIEAYHRLCPHTSITTEFDTIYDGLTFTGTACLGIISCNVPWEQNYDVNCSMDINNQYQNMFNIYGKLDLIKDIGINTKDDDDAINQHHLNIFIFAFAAIFSFIFVV